MAEASLHVSNVATILPTGQFSPIGYFEKFKSKGKNQFDFNYVQAL